MLILAIIASLGLLALSIYIHKSRTARLVNDGQIIDRKNDFARKAEEFTLTVSDKSQVTDGVKTLDYPSMNVSMNGDSEKQAFLFKGATFEAQLWLKSEGDGKCVYEFNFLHWKEPNDISTLNDFYNMNRLITALKECS